VVAHVVGCESVKRHVVSRMDSNELALEVRRKLRDHQPLIGQDFAHGIAVVLALGGLLQVEQTAIPGRNLDTLVAELRGPLGHVLERVERRRVARKLREEDFWSLNRFHVSLAPTRSDYKVQRR